MNLLVSVIFIAIFNILLTNYLYNITDKNYYRCSKFTHAFGFILPIISISFILYLYNKKILKFTNNFVTHFSMVILGFSFSMISFHYNYELNKSQN